MTEINKDIEKYLSQVKAYLPCKKSDKAVILEDIRQAISEFAENSDIQSIDDIYKRFGTPEEIAKAYLSDAEPNNIKKAINIRKLLVAAVVIALVIIASSYLIALIDNHSGKISQYSEIIIEGTSTVVACIKFHF